MPRLNQKRGSDLTLSNKNRLIEKYKISEQRGNGIFTNLINRLPSSDEMARPMYSGEKHMVLKLKNGKSGMANYMGPGTQVLKRLERGDPGRTPADMVAKRHDVDFTLAQTAPNKQEQLKMARTADNRMVKSLKEIQKGKHGGDAFRNIQAGMRGIEAKMALENRGLLSPSKFAGDLKKFTPKETGLLMSARNDLEQKGYGHCGSGLGLPGSGLKKKLLSQMKRDKLKKKVSAIVKMSGRGLTLPGGELLPTADLLNFVVKDMVPNLLKKSGLKKLPMKTLAPLIGAALKMSKGKNVEGLAKNLSTAILPLLTLQKLKGMNMRGNGLMDVFSIMKKKINAKLVSAIGSALKAYIASHQRGSGLKLAGQGMCGGGIFSSIGSAFKKAFSSIPRAALAVGSLGISETFLQPLDLLKSTTGIKGSKIIDTAMPVIGLVGGPELRIASGLTSKALKGMDL
tara:strand:+ start:7543 stop:8910 length:1368 start_codon:yes stop_codon:yes gene_type:complete